MSDFIRVRVALVGSDDDLHALLYTMLDNLGEIENDPDEAPMTNAEMEQEIHLLAQRESGNDSGFIYEMVAPHPFGSAISGTAAMSVKELPVGCKAVVFTYDSAADYQPEDWLSLHKRCGRPPMLVMWANSVYGVSSGTSLLTNGHALDNWDTMDETYLFLIKDYFCSYPPEDCLRKLKELQEDMQREDAEITVEGLLQNAVDNLQELQRVSETGTEKMQLLLTQARESRDFQLLQHLNISLCEAEVWDVERSHKYIACLQSSLEAWQNEMTEM